jgi:tetratricopeptide (TPR) repeat protein
MSHCPSCGKPALTKAWFCAFCATPLRTDEELSAETALIELQSTEAADEAPFASLNDPAFAEELTHTLAWSRAPDVFTGEALIVGELSLEIPIEDPISMTFGAVAPAEDGSLRGLLLYADRSSAKYLSPSAVPRLTQPADEVVLTPYERYLVTYINGRRSIRELQEAGLLAPEEMSSSILTLIDRGLVSLDPPRSQADYVERTEQVHLDEIAGPPIDDLHLPPRPGSPEPPPLAPPVLEASALVELAPEPSPLPTPPAPSSSSAAKGSVIQKRAKVTPPTRAEAPAPPAGSSGPRKKQESKAKDLYEAALRDKAAGNYVSARMNLKLAVAFHPNNPVYQALFRSLVDAPAPQVTEPKPLHGAAAKLYEEAERAEAGGELDRTIRLLERALQVSKEAVILNRLGVILATKKRDFGRAQELLEAAVELDPQNAAYVHNLSKILAAAALRLAGHPSDGSSKEPPRRSRLASFWDRLRGKKR